MSYEALRKKSEVYQWGYQGEEKLKRTLLSNLGDEFTGFFGVPIPKRGDIDCLLVGPTGVFVIEVKNYKGVLFFKKGKLFRKKTSYTGKIRIESLQKTKSQVENAVNFVKSLIKLDVPVKGILVFTDKATWIKKHKVTKFGKVRVCKVDELVKVLKSGSKDISSQKLREINELLVRKFVSKGNKKFSK